MRHATFAAMILALGATAACGRPPHTVVDATGKTVGEIIRWDDRIPNYPLNAIVAYKVQGDDVGLVVTSGAIRGLQEASGGSVVLFTTPDCSGNKLFAMLSVTPL